MKYYHIRADYDCEAFCGKTISAYILERDLERAVYHNRPMDRLDIKGRKAYDRDAICEKCAIAYMDKHPEHSPKAIGHVIPC